MTNTKQKQERRQKLKWRIRAKIAGTAERPRLSVFRSNKAIYAQIINDATGETLAAADSMSLKATGTKIEQSQAVGKAIAEKAKGANIENCIFDRGGYLYHGRVKALADGAREGGLNF